MGRSGAFAPCPLRIGVFSFLSVVIIVCLVLQVSILLHPFLFNSVHPPLLGFTPSSPLSSLWCT